MGSRAVVLACRDDEPDARVRARFGPGMTGAGVRAARRPSTPGPGARSSMRRGRGSCWRWFVRRYRAPDCGRSWARAGCCWTASCCRGRSRPGTCCGTSTRRSGAAARAALPAAARRPGRRRPAGWTWRGCAGRTAARAANAAAFSAAYRRYCWPVHGLDGIRLAPFQLLATEGAIYHDREHGWHLAPGRPAGRRRAGADHSRPGGCVVDTADPESVAAGVAWWTELTEAGGEGMVVKPPPAWSGGRGGWPSRESRSAAGSTCGSSTGRTTPSRGTWPGCGTATWAGSARWRCGSTRSASRPWNGRPRGEPLWRVHEAVFGVLALESEPVDPRL